MKIRIALILVMTAVFITPGLATAGWRYLDSSDIEVDIIGDGSYRPLDQHILENSRRLYRGYFEANDGRGYQVRVRNRSNQRIGVVISVDGRNIISGKSSDLGHDERMYVLGPYETETYRGWRTGKNRINRFYFTEAPDSFAGRWGDYSSMGVVAVAAFEDRSADHSINKFRRHKSEPKGKKGGKISPRHSPYGDEAGTGIGHAERSPSRLVNFDPRRKPFARVYLKYEWPESLCAKGIGHCYNHYRKGSSRKGRDRGGYVRVPPRNDFLSSDWW